MSIRLKLVLVTFGLSTATLLAGPDSQPSPGLDMDCLWPDGNGSACDTHADFNRRCSGFPGLFSTDCGDRMVTNEAVSKAVPSTGGGTDVLYANAKCEFYKARCSVDMDNFPFTYWVCTVDAVLTVRNRTTQIVGGEPCGVGS